MPKIVAPGQGVIFMKVGTHAQETLADIIARKTKEIEDEGYALWGYGGNSCHPQTMVQPFAESFVKRGTAIYLCMQEVNSRHFAEPIRAQKCSSDGLNWELIPPGINVRGSRFALVIESLGREEFELPLVQTRIAVGPSMGREGSKYLKGQVDKACLEIIPKREAGKEDDLLSVNIGLVAQLRSPYAVFVK